MTVTVATAAEQKKFGGKLRIKSTWYKQQSVLAACNTRGAGVDRSAAYLPWLAAARGWLSTTIRCPTCKGTGREEFDRWRNASYRRTYKRCTGREYDGTCHQCDGTGRAASWCRCPACFGHGRPNDGAYCTRCGNTGEVFALAPDIARAESHVESQRRELERRARRGVDIARWRLLLRGAVPLTYQPYCGHWHIWEPYPGELRCGFAGAGHWRMVARPSYTAERDDLFRLPDGRVLYLGTEPRRGRQHDTPHDLALVIEPGRAPAEAEACRLVDELMIGEPAEQPLPLAA